MFWLGAIVSLCYVPGVTGAYIATQWPLLAVALSFGLLRKGPFTPFHLAWILFVAYAVATVFFSPLPNVSKFGVWLVVIMGLALWFGTTLERTRELYAGLAVGAAVSSAVAVLQWFGVNLLPSTSQTYAGMYVNSVQQGTVLALVAVALATKRMWWGVLPLLPGIALSQSKGAWVALAVGLLACHFQRLWVVKLLIPAVAGAVAAFFLFGTMSPSDVERLSIWRFAWDASTWFGNGAGILYAVMLPAKNGVLFFPEHAHNDALQLVFEYGIGAALPISVFAYAACRTDAVEWPVVAAFVAASCYSMPLYMPIASFLVLVAVGRILRSYGVARGHGSDGGFTFVPRERLRFFGLGRARVSVSQNFASKS